MFGWKKALTPEQAELLARFREFEQREGDNYGDEDAADDDSDDYVDDTTGAAFKACRKLVVACCKNPKGIDIKPVLQRALVALELEPDFVQRVLTALAIEAADEQEALKRFPRIAWQKEVASGKTDLGYDVWFEQKSGVKRREQ
jgi:hypothetical protein